MTISCMRFVPHLMLAICLPLVGCQERPPATSGETTTPAKAPEAAGTSADGKPDVTVEVKSWAEVQQMVGEHRGKVVVLDVWSTWCDPCKREFPNLVKLHRRFPERVACISVDIDYIGRADQPPESFHDTVLEFLGKHEAAFQNVISSDPDEDVLDALEVGSIPAVLVYDREGNLKKKFTNDDNEYGDEGFTYPQHIVPLVEELLIDDDAPDNRDSSTQSPSGDRSLDTEGSIGASREEDGKDE